MACLRQRKIEKARIPLFEIKLVADLRQRKIDNQESRCLKRRNIMNSSSENDNKQ